MACHNYYDLDYESDMGLYGPITSLPFDLDWFKYELAVTDLFQLDGYLNLAIEHGLPLEAIQLLIEAGADPDGNSECEESPLSLAALTGYTVLVSLLLQHGANPDLANPDEEELQSDIEELLEAAKDD